MLDIFTSDAYCESYLALSVSTLGTLSERFNSYFSKNTLSIFFMIWSSLNPNLSILFLFCGFITTALFLGIATLPLRGRGLKNADSGGS